MGKHFGNNIGAGSKQRRNGEKNQLEKKLEQSFLFWFLLLCGALLFFLSSVFRISSVKGTIAPLLPVLLLFLSFALFLSELKERKKRIFQKERKKKMIEIFIKQKKELKNIFDLKKQLKPEIPKKIAKESGPNSSINLVLLDDKIIKEESERRILEKKEIEKNKEGINLINALEREKEDFGIQNTDFSKKMVEGEDITHFPPEWQEFFIENEGKDSREKLNKMLEGID